MRIKNLAFLMCAIGLMFLVSCKGNSPENAGIQKNENARMEKEADVVRPDESEKIKFRIVDLYFVNPNTGTLKIEKRQVFDLKEKTSMIKQVLRSLKLGPVTRLKPSVPQNIEFKDVFVYGDKVFIDLHKNQESSYIGGVEGERLFLEAVVKTVLNISPDYKKVFFLMDGEEVESILGHLDSSEYFSKNSF